MYQRNFQTMRLPVLMIFLTIFSWDISSCNRRHHRHWNRRHSSSSFPFSSFSRPPSAASFGRAQKKPSEFCHSSLGMGPRSAVNLHTTAMECTPIQHKYHTPANKMVRHKKRKSKLFRLHQRLISTCTLEFGLGRFPMPSSSLVASLSSSSSSSSSLSQS